MSTPKPVSVLCFAAYGILAIAIVAYSQTSIHETDGRTREEVIETIKRAAQHDARANKPGQTPHDLDLLFGADAARTGLKLIDVKSIYDEAYATESKEREQWKLWRPNIGWLLAAILLLLHLVRDALKDLVTRHFKSIGQKAYERILGDTSIQRRSLRKYRASLVRTYSKFKLPFRSDVELSMEKIYVPLKVAGTGNTDQVDSLNIIATHKHLIILGTPGAGKSILLKRLALHYGSDQLKQSFDAPTLVLLELRRFNNSEKSLVEHLVDVLSLHGFSKSADPYLRRSMIHGRLMILLDGLDEVSSKKREQVVASIADLLQRYPECRVIVTCRTAVYKGQLDSFVDQTLEIVEFTDQQIQKFLSSWPNLPNGRSIEPLLLTLKERPRIMALARNPLLLTMIAFLYSNVEDFVLPHSRTEFYSQAVQVLLSTLKWEHNAYKPAHKQLILEHLALFNQTKRADKEEDRLSIDFETVIAQINPILPNLNLTREDAMPLLDEIIERNGLILAIDGGVRYQFSHLTLQEFFAASALKNHSNHLLEHFRVDADAWREVVKLWCGFAHDSTSLIREVRKLDRVTAIECLADAQLINQVAADEMVNSLKSEFGRDISLTTAFASVASGPNRRGQQVLRFLADLLASGPDDEIRLEAISALSLSNKPEAANILTEYSEDHPEALRYLVQMGDVAVAGIATRAQTGSRVAIEALGVIGTPDAARALVPLLWDTEVKTREVAALVLGTLLSEPVITSTLSSYPLTTEQRNAPCMEWVYLPFVAPESSVALIAGRIASLLPFSAVSLRDLIAWPLDERIVVPVAIDLRQRFNISEKQIAASSAIHEALEQLMTAELPDLNRVLQPAESKARSVSREKVILYNEDASDALKPETPLDSLFKYPTLRGTASSLFLVLRHLNSPNRLKLLRILLDSKPPTVKDWLGFARQKFFFSRSGQFRIIRLITLVVVVFSLAQIKREISQSSDELETSLLILCGISLIASVICFLFLRRGAKTWAFQITFAGLYTLPKWLFSKRIDFMETDEVKTDRDYKSSKIFSFESPLVDSVTELIPIYAFLIPLLVGFLSATLLITPVTIFFASVFLLNYISFPLVCIIWIAVFSIMIALWIDALRQERKSNSPLLFMFDRISSSLK